MDQGRAMRGATFLRIGGPTPKAATGTRPCHLVDWQCGSLKTVTRSTFTSELMSSIAATDHGLSLKLTLHEIASGPLGPDAAMKLRDGAMECIFQMHLGIDSMGLLTAVTAPRPKAPAEKSLLPHLLWMRDLLKVSVMKTLSWYDTRDMSSDGLTKGCIDRAALLELAGGTVTRKHHPQTMAVSSTDVPFAVHNRD